MSKEKIAILGGGVSAMTAACYLTDKADWQEKYDITVYQLGWRIGGKGASGRNPELGQRIEEHGLHVWFGAYVNSFKTIQSVYAQNNRPQSMPLATFDEAFKPHSFIALEEHIDNGWRHWDIEFPEIPGNPADCDLDPEFWDLVKLMYYWLKQIIDNLMDVSEAKTEIKKQDDDESWFERMVDYIKDEYQELKEDIHETNEMLHSFISALREKDNDDQEHHQSTLERWLNKLRIWLHEEFDELLEDNDEIRRLYISADLAITVMKGCIADNVYRNGFGYLNQWDFREWLTIHGANVKFSVNSAPIRGFYDLVFGYEDGDFNKPNVEAGVSLLAMLRIALCYKGGVMWKMQAGMGDTIFSPIYELLTKRGVKFEFFHQVQELIPENGNISQIRITQQVTLADPQQEYYPLVDVKGLPCWPSIPNYAQIEPAQVTLLRENNICLESFWSNWPHIYEQHFGQPLPEKTLKLGEDFDKVIYAISIASLPHLCPQLLQQDQKLKLCSERVKAVATQAYQVWTDVPFGDLGWKDLPKDGEQPILSGFVEPYDTWAAMNQLLCREDWQGGVDPKNVAYFCSAFTQSIYPPQSEHDFPVQMRAQAKQNAINHLTQDMHFLWPEVANAGSFSWSILTDPNDNAGEKRFDAQYWRANVDPSERYVMSVKGSSQYRLDTQATAFDNLYITGDWINTGVNAGCVEAAVMAGMETSRAICGYPEKINGEHGFKPYKGQKRH